MQPVGIQRKPYRTFQPTDDQLQLAECGQTMAPYRSWINGASVHCNVCSGWQELAWAIPCKLYQERKNATGFANLLPKIDSEYRPIALKILQKDGWEQAIAFCHSKLQPSVMQAQRDFENLDSQK